jgi:predicted unusual protein kinase regulating ubiquinone biosynthesis (AarF/ABC1/UbiB family)
MDLISLGCIALTEGVRYACTRDVKDFVVRVGKKSVRVNVVYTKIIQALAAAYLDGPFNVENTADVPAPVIDGVMVEGIIGSGLVAVVYRGVFEGNAVAIKVLRPGILETLRRGIGRAKAVARALSCLPCLKPLNLVSFVQQTTDLLESQVDFEQEARHQLRFTLLSASVPNVTVPKLYLYTPTYIVSELLVPAEGDNEVRAKAIISLLVKGLSFDMFLHGDLHLGNLIFIGDTVGVIDFGIMVDLPKGTCDALLTVFMSIHKKHFEVGARALIYEFASPRSILETLDAVELLGLVDGIAEVLKSADIRGEIGLREINDIMRVAYRYGINVDDKFHIVILAMAASDQVIKRLSPKALELVKEEMALMDELEK